MKKKQSLGFTLVEILVVISIIAVLSIIVIPLISGYLKSGKDNYNKSLESELVLVGEDYFANNKNKLPRGTSYSTFVTLSELESSNMVSGEFIDSENGKCRDNSYVRVIRDFYTDEYTYYGCLDCENYRSDSKYCNISDLSHDYNFSCDIILDPQEGWTNNYKINVKAKNNLNLSKVYYSNNSFKNVGTNTFSDEITINATSNSNFINGKMFAFWVEDIAGNIEICSKEVKFDITDPTCRLEDLGNNTASVSCSDEGGSGCKDSNPKTVQIEKGEAKATVYDNAGNKGECNRKFDNTAPKCIVTKNPSTEWSKTDVTITGTCKDEDGGTGCVTSTVTRTIKTEGSGSYSPGEVCDKADNCKTCDPISVKIDKTKPSCSTIKNPASAWSNKDVVVTGTCTDNEGGSGCTSPTVTKTVQKEGSDEYGPGKVYDKAGNEKTCSSILVQIDKTKPTCASTVSTSAWTNQNVTLTGTCSDKGGSTCKKSTVTNTIKTEGSADYSPGDVCDNADNCTSCPKKTVKIDKTGPTCSGAERNGCAGDNIQYKYTFTDNLSGVYAEKHGHCYTSESHIVNVHRCSYSSPYDRLSSASYKKFSSPSKTVIRNYGYNYGKGTVRIYFKLKDVAGNEAFCKLHTVPYKYSYSHTWSSVNC